MGAGGGIGLDSAGAVTGGEEPTPVAWGSPPETLLGARVVASVVKTTVPSLGVRRSSRSRSRPAWPAPASGRLNKTDGVAGGTGTSASSVERSARSSSPSRRRSPRGRGERVACRNRRISKVFRTRAANHAGIIETPPVYTASPTTLDYEIRKTSSINPAGGRIQLPPGSGFPLTIYSTQPSLRSSSKALTPPVPRARPSARPATRLGMSPPAARSRTPRRPSGIAASPEPVGPPRMSPRQP